MFPARHRTSRVSPAATSLWLTCVLGACPHLARAADLVSADHGTSVAVCSDPRIQIAPHIAPRWLEAISNLCDTFGSLKDVDPVAQLRLVPAGDDVVLEASLDEGRVALRRVKDPHDLPTLVEALTVVIRPAAESLHIPLEGLETPPPPRVALEPIAAVPRSAPGSIEIGTGIGARLSGGHTYFSPELSVYAGLRPGTWLLGVTTRWAPAEVPAVNGRSGYEMETIGAGFLVAHRFVQKPAFALDAGASALVLVVTQSLEGRLPDDEVGSQTDARFGLVMRALIGASSWRLAPAIDADISPARVRQSFRISPELPSLPSWSLALTLGGTWVDS